MSNHSLPPYQRRRSHSAHAQASPIRDFSGRIASHVTKKRAHASTCTAAPSSYESPTKWDVDRWRRGKRPRRDSMSDHSSTMPRLSLSSSSSSSQGGPPSTPTLPCTPADFDLFPATTKRRRSTIDDSMDGLFDEQEVSKIRSDAFWELRRSVEESGEGLIQKMREYESNKRTSAHSGRPARDRGRARYSHPNTTTAADQDDEDEEDIQIFSGFTAAATSPLISPAATTSMDSLGRKRAFSLGGTQSCFDLEGSDGATCDSGQSAYATDEEEDEDEFMHVSYPDTQLPTSSPLLTGNSSPATGFSFSNIFIPSLSLSTSHTRNTSSTSISSRHHAPSHQFTFTSPLSLSASASRNERAIAALTLAMANGAGGLNDYSAARVFDTRQDEEDIDIGELWH